ncbi:MAG: phenazine biosynthesis protein [Candidatus Rokuibacteriota bacterium]|nr:MAG: phenazine biosynthesis protein [Candidatus Rokubacteria bacterium]
MSIASDLLRQHFETLVDDNPRWQTLIADELVWELPYASSIGHPDRLSGREAVVRHVTWFLGAVEKFRFSDVRVQALADGDAAIAEVKAEGLIKSTGRVYRQEYVVFLRAGAGKITFLREYFDPVRAARALDTPIVGLQG